jgi:hypothetical protein
MPKFDFSPWAKLNLYDLVARDTGIDREIVKFVLLHAVAAYQFISPSPEQAKAICGAARVYTQDAELYRMGPAYYDIERLPGIIPRRQGIRFPKLPKKPS